MTADEICDAMLRRDEGRERMAYPDPLTGGAPWTIGIGHTGPEVRQGLVWTDDQIESAFAIDKRKARDGVTFAFPWSTRLDGARVAVLWAMAFQMGVARMRGFAHMLAACERGDFVIAAAEMMSSTWAKQTPKRVDRMAKQLESGTYGA
jgi:lysozyme